SHFLYLQKLPPAQLLKRMNL
ncbi:hypothetical protein D039_4974B, partial [Vibrio parahaemolyticus EKP-028]